MAIFNEHTRDTQKRSHSEVDENEEDEEGADSDSEATTDLANAADLAERCVLSKKVATIACTIRLILPSSPLTFVYLHVLACVLLQPRTEPGACAAHASSQKSIPSVTSFSSRSSRTRGDSKSTVVRRCSEPNSVLETYVSYPLKVYFSICFSFTQYKLNTSENSNNYWILDTSSRTWVRLQFLLLLPIHVTVKPGVPPRRFLAQNPARGHSPGHGPLPKRRRRKWQRGRARTCRRVCVLGPGSRARGREPQQPPGRRRRGERRGSRRRFLRGQ